MLKEMYSLNIEPFAVRSVCAGGLTGPPLTASLARQLPMDASFPLAAFYSKVEAKKDQDELRAYLLQARQELTSRLAELVIDPATNRPSKWWMCFLKRKFLGKSLDPAGK